MMKHLKLYEAFNEDSKIEKVNDFILYFLVSSYFEKNTEVIAGNDGGYIFYVMKRVKGTIMKKSVIIYNRGRDMEYFGLNSDFLRKRLKRHLRKCLGLQYRAPRDIINPIVSYCVKKMNITNIRRISLSMYHNNLYEALKTI